MADELAVWLYGDRVAIIEHARGSRRYDGRAMQSDLSLIQCHERAIEPVGRQSEIDETALQSRKGD